MKKINKILLILFALILIWGCTTQKSRSDISALGELYHNTTAHYNGYFNADELLAASRELLDEQHQDNYTRLLPMYKYVAVENAQSQASNLDEAIKKVTVVVNLHPYSKWVDDCYLLAGKAQYLKQDYEAAEETFRYMIVEYSPEKMKENERVSKQDKKVKKKKKKKRRGGSKKKKKGGKKTKMDKQRENALKKYNKAIKKAKKKGGKAPPKPDILKRSSEKEQVTVKEDETISIAEEDEEKKADEAGQDDGFLKHRPAFQEGMLWLARTLIERDNYDGAMLYISELERDPKTYSDILGELAAVKAYYHIHRGDYVQALPALDDAIEAEKDRIRRARYAFIMAQIFQMQGNGEGAYAAFRQALRAKPGYEMEFNCRLNMAQNAWASGAGSSLTANLDKMLKDPKNDEYQDQIYFALAQIALKEGDREDAINNLKLSLENSRQNQAQRAESYFTLARLYYEGEEYVPAKNYYDSTLQVMADTDERYKEVERLSTNLEDIAKNILIIERQDSLLLIGQMSDAEKEALALKIKREEDERRRQAIAAKANASQPGNRFATARRNVGGGGALQKESDFFAYDDRSLKRGQREFERKWGNRPLEDNWRRSTKRGGDTFEEEFEEITKTSDILTDEEVKTLLGDVPETEGQIAAANLRIQEAMFALGSLYRERLRNLPKAVTVLEELNRRYPSNNYELDSWYQLYLAHNDLGNRAKAQTYADKILEKYQTSTYAMVIKNPNYADELIKEGRKLNNYYDQAYAAFTSGNYSEAYRKSVSAKEEFGAANPLQAKFALLAAMSTGSLEGKDAYIKALQGVVARYPDTDEQRRAREILRLLGESAASLPGGAGETIEQFKVDDNALHYVLVVFKDKDIDLNRNKIAVSDYNQKYHKLDRISINNIYLGVNAEDRLPILVMRKFKNKAEAMKYYNGVQLNKKDFIDASVEHEVFAVNQNNYREILKEKSVENYRAFFNINYLD